MIAPGPEVRKSGSPEVLTPSADSLSLELSHRSSLPEHAKNRITRDFRTSGLPDFRTFANDFRTSGPGQS